MESKSCLRTYNNKNLACSCDRTSATAATSLQTSAAWLTWLYKHVVGKVYLDIISSASVGLTWTVSRQKTPTWLRVRIPQWLFWWPAFNTWWYSIWHWAQSVVCTWKLSLHPVRMALDSRDITFALDGVWRRVKSTNPLTRPRRMLVILSKRPNTTPLFMFKSGGVEHSGPLWVGVSAIMHEKNCPFRCTKKGYSSKILHAPHWCAHGLPDPPHISFGVGTCWVCVQFNVLVPLSFTYKFFVWGHHLLFLTMWVIGYH